MTGGGDVVSCTVRSKLNNFEHVWGHHARDPHAPPPGLVNDRLTDGHTQTKNITFP